METDESCATVLSKFAPASGCLKDLATSLRDALFLRGAKLHTETSIQATIILYEQIISAFIKFEVWRMTDTARCVLILAATFFILVCDPDGMEHACWTFLIKLKT